ncbi:helix-turn-helix domain-containing protein [Nocardioides sp. Kera G14]|uniref:TetR/AcrR family transcriptional regulator n=1 Tax=Nocardioides sp. Kera G14 TaxID=2884264 RepID=UPI002AAFFE84|nr:helix-turn-helix domain-containing protein [Nocardioides sp. Kera G14]
MSADTQAPRPLRADAQRNRDKIIEAGRTLIREKGIDATSMDEIAKAAGVGAGTLYRHFKTKDELYEAATARWAETVNGAADAALAIEGTDRDRLIAWLRSYVDFLTAHKGAAWRITAAMGDEESPYAMKCRTYLHANERVIEGLGSLRSDVDAMELVRLVGGIAAVVDNSELSEDAVRPLIAVLADGLLK